jgi:outer membrane lipoprotein-sorting protein
VFRYSRINILAAALLTRRLLFAAFIVHPGIQLAQPVGFSPVADPGRLVALLNDHSSGIQSILSDFTQKKHLAFLDETIVSKGKFWFRKENNLRWEYEDPFEYAIILSQGKFQIKDGDRVSVYDIKSNAVFREINDLIIGMVKGDITDRDKYEVQAYESGGRYMVQLVPLDSNMREVISVMEVYFNRADLMVSEIIMKESETDYTEITFSSRRINEIIPDPVFTTGY